jgi:hypothetical protein
MMVIGKEFTMMFGAAKSCFQVSLEGIGMYCLP